LCEGIGLRAHTFTKINKDKEKFNPKLAQKFGNNDYIEYLQSQTFVGILVVCGVPHAFIFNQNINKYISVEIIICPFNIN